MQPGPNSKPLAATRRSRTRPGLKVSGRAPPTVGQNAPRASWLVAYFATMGYPLERIRWGSALYREGERWQLRRNDQGRPVALFGSREELWNWWKAKAAALIRGDDYYRLLCAWYRQGNRRERAVLRKWVDVHPGSPSGSDPRTDLEFASPLPLLSELPSDWPARAQNIENNSNRPGERCRHRFSRFVLEEDLRREARELDDATPLATCRGTGARRL